MNAVFAFLAGLFGLVGLGAPEPPTYWGYVETDYVYVAPKAAGTIETIAVSDGDRIEKGAVLARLDAAQAKAAVAAAEAEVAAAEATYDNLTTGGRAEEVAVARASLAKAQSDLELARSKAERTRKLFGQGFASAAQRDQADAAVESATAQVNQLAAQLEVTQLPARTAQQIAAQAQLDAARANADKARAALADLTLTAPAGGRVERVYYQEGEVAAVGVPLMALQPEGPLKVEFFIAEPERALFRLGDTLKVSCDSCAGELTAKLTWMASDPETTPPVIYSREERTRLVFMAEATLTEPEGLLPGQPVTVTRP